MNIRIALLSAAAGALLTAAPAQSADWPRWRGPDLNGISKETAWSPKALNGEPKILWRAKIGMGFSSFAVADGRVYTTGNAADTDTLFCFDAETGKELWKHSYPEPLDPKYYEGGTSATPSVDGDTVYQMARKGQAIALDAQTGKVKWAKNVAKEVGAEVPTWGFAASPVVHGELLVLYVCKHGTSLEKKSG